MAKSKPAPSHMAQMFDAYTPAPRQAPSTGERWERGSTYRLGHTGLVVEVAAYRVFSDNSYLPYSEAALLRHFGVIE